jgi:hypothetical protein
MVVPGTVTLDLRSGAADTRMVDSGLKYRGSCPVWLEIPSHWDGERVGSYVAGFRAALERRSQ